MYLLPYDQSSRTIVHDIKVWVYIHSGTILCMQLANERQPYIVTLSLIGWVHTQNDPSTWCLIYLMYNRLCLHITGDKIYVIHDYEIIFTSIALVLKSVLHPLFHTRFKISIISIRSFIHMAFMAHDKSFVFIFCWDIWLSCIYCKGNTPEIFAKEFNTEMCRCSPVVL